MRKRKEIFIDEYNRLFMQIGYPLYNAVGNSMEDELKNKLSGDLLFELRKHIIEFIGNYR